ncbi:amino acid adenylation domain-containing protein [Actinoplanes sp. HUAS TT8]|uniref:amino acid adenylation domain-containing protein n=1 Tax=Actinoplanes sp. HUAS TT8 TaxID=3447453 RepID=UPI003F51BA1C
MLPVLVDDQAVRTPDAIAVEAGDVRLTYRELVARSNRLARLLVGRGVASDDLVGVCFERGVDLVVAMLGVWKAGAGFVPLDPGQPRDRLEFVQRDTGIRLTLTESRLADLVRDPVCLDLESSALADLADATVDVPLSESGRAYAIYTSGSTGRPKGVMVEHAGIANRTLWGVRQVGLGADDRFLHKTSIAFDAHVWEIFAPLVSGGCVVLAPVGAERDAALLVDTVASTRATILQVVPSVLRLLTEQPGWAHCRSLRALFCAGEVLSAELALRATEGLDLELWNTYGPTECSIDVTAHRFDRDQPAGSVPIGRPIPGLRAVVLDDRGELAAVGLPGELFVGGVGVARGYLGRPDLTAERFVPDPFGPPGSRLYRTGDIAKWRHDSRLEYVGRVDLQVKIDGVRVEPGEVEAALEAHPLVRAAVVTTFVAATGDKRLGAYVVAPESVGAGELRDFVAERLPAAFVPAATLVLAEFPLNSSGKVDRKRLPALVDQSPRDDLRTENEHVVAEAWRSVLGVAPTGRGDDFFQLGGSSLQITALYGRLVDAGSQLRLGDLFTFTTVAAQALLLGRDGVERPAVPVAAETGDSQDFPLSYGQHRLWVLDRISPESPEWIAPLFMTLAAGVTAGTVVRALELLQERHEILRTRYVVVDGTPRQRVEPSPKIDLTVLADASAELRALLNTGFDLEAGPVWRAVLEPAESGPRLGLLFHHIASDGHSTVVLREELQQLIAAVHHGREPELPPIELRYADFAVWQQEELSLDRLGPELDYWRRQLAGLPTIELPADRPRPAERDGRGALVPVTIPAASAERLVEFGRRRGATPFATVLAAYAVLLSRYTSGTDLPIGVPIAGRTRPEWDRVVGFFLNALVLRCDLAGNPTFAELIDRVRDMTRDGFAHQELPFEWLVEDLKPQRDLSRTPLYQIAFDLHEEGASGTSDDLRRVDDEGAAWSAAKTDLSLLLHRAADGELHGYLEFATALYDAGTVERVGHNLARLVESLAADPYARIGAVDFLGPDELAIAAAAPVAPSAFPARTLHEVIAGRADQDPDAVAVVFEDETLTYRELDTRANRLAHRLVELGAEPERMIGICLPPGVELVVAVLAVLKSGAAYLPLDPFQPADRLAYIASDARTDLVLTDGRVRESLATVEARVLALDDPAETELIARAPAHRPATTVEPGNLSYVIYTSGTSGRPKGVAITHANVLRLFSTTAHQFGIGADDALTLFHSYAFDVSVFEIFGALLHGARLVVVPRAVSRNPEEFLALLERQRVTVLSQTPSAFSNLLSADHGRANLSLRFVVFAGERLQVADLRPWLAGRGSDQPRLINMYGITETTVHNTFHDVTAEDEFVVGSPVGVPLDDLSATLVADGGGVAPIGAVGDIHVGGGGLARGYLNRPSLTAERFVPDPHGEPGARRYRSGDLARRLPDGTLRYLGRADLQVKLRGYRIELGEITAELGRHPTIRQAAVVVSGDHLVAYLVPEGPAPEPGVLREHLAKVLPDYMLPSAYVELEQLPLTVNGKLDVRALPAPGLAARAVTGSALPETDAQKRVAELIEELLGDDLSIGLDDNFFAIGGNSILAVRLTAAIQEAFDLSFSVRQVFEQPTVRRLAATVEELIIAELDGLTDDEILGTELN